MMEYTDRMKLDKQGIVTWSRRFATKFSLSSDLLAVFIMTVMYLLITPFTYDISIEFLFYLSFLRVAGRFMPLLYNIISMYSLHHATRGFYEILMYLDKLSFLPSQEMADFAFNIQCLQEIIYFEVSGLWVFDNVKHPKDLGSVLSLNHKKKKIALKISEKLSI